MKLLVFSLSIFLLPVVHASSNSQTLDDLANFARDESEPPELRLAAIEKLSEARSPLTEGAALAFLRDPAEKFALYEWDAEALGESYNAVNTVLEKLYSLATPAALDTLRQFRPVARNKGSRAVGAASYRVLEEVVRNWPDRLAWVSDGLTEAEALGDFEGIGLFMSLIGDAKIVELRERVQTYLGAPWPTELRSLAIESYGKLGVDDGTSRPEIIEALRDEKLSHVAGFALGQMGDPTALRAVYEQYRANRDTNHRLQFIETFIRYKSPLAMPYLRRIARRDPVDFYRNKAAKRLLELRGFRPQFDPRQGYFYNLQPFGPRQKLQNLIAVSKGRVESILGFCERRLGFGI